MAKLAKSKTATDDTPVAPKDISGDVTNANVLGDSNSPRPKRKRAGDFFDFEEDEAVVDGAGKASKPTSTQPKKKTKTASAPEKKARSSKGEEKATPTNDKKPKPSKGDTKTTSAAKEKTDHKSKDQADPKAKKNKIKPSKEDGHPVVTEKAQPGGDMVETEPKPQPKAQKKHEKTSGNKDTAAKKDMNSDEKNSASSRVGVEPANDKGVAGQEEQASVEPISQPKNKARGKAGKKGASGLDGKDAGSAPDTEEAPSQAKAIESISAPKGRKNKGKNAEPKVKALKPETTADVETPHDTSGQNARTPKPSKVAKTSDKSEGRRSEPAPPQDSASKKAKAGRSAKAKDAGAEKNVEGAGVALAESSTAAPEQAMDQTPFKKLLKRDRAKMPVVKASADAADAERKANPSTNAEKSVGKDKKVSKAKGSGATPSKEFEEAASVKADAPKGKKRKDGPTSADTKAESGPSEKKPRKARKSALDVATGAVGDLVQAGIEAAEQGVNAVKDLASGLGDKSIADDVTAVAESAVEEKSKEDKKVAKAAAKKDENPKQDKGKEKAVNAVDENATDEETSDLDEGDQTLALIQGFESDEEDSHAPGESAEGFKEGMEVPQLPTDKNDLTQKLEAAKDDSKDGPGVIYVGRIPHGFYEPQMRAYFSQFGPLLRLRLSRNRTTGASKHYAFLEFDSAAVAAIVADTMDNYLMFGHILKVRVVPREQVHENLWKGAGKRFKRVPWARIEGRKLERGVGREQWGKRVEAERKRREKKGEKAREEMGYAFDGPEIKGVEEKTVVTTDGKDGTVVVSEEVKVTKVKKGGKRKVGDEKDGDEEAKEVKKAKTAGNA